MYTDNRAIPGLDPVYNYKSYTFRQLVAGTQLANETGVAYLPIHPIGDGKTTLQASVPASSGNYFLTSLSNGGQRSIKITNAAGAAATDAAGRGIMNDEGARL
jgi:hypothetical protein